MKDTAAEGLKAAPPVAVTVAHYVAGMNLNDWVLTLTLVYTALAVIHKVWTMVREWKKKH